MGLFSDRLDRLTVLSALGFFVMLVSLGIVVIGRAGLSVLIPLTVCFGVVFTIYPVAMARAQDNIFEEQVPYIPIHRAHRQQHRSPRRTRELI